MFAKTVTLATFRFSSRPVQASTAGRCDEASAGANSLSSPSIFLPSKLRPSSVEKAMFNWSLPEPFHARNSRPPCDAIAGDVSLDSARMQLLLDALDAVDAHQRGALHSGDV